MEFVEFVIGNSGPTIPEEHLSQIFDSFFTAGKREGTGLGLAVAKRIVEAHGGKIWCEANVNGVEFKFILPIAKGSDYSNSKTNEKSTPSTDSLKERFLIDVKNDIIRILIVDDEFIYQKGIEYLISSDNSIRDHVQFYFANTGAEAVTIAKKIRPHVVFQDLDLGKMSVDGFETIKLMRAENIDAHVCIHSNRLVDTATAIRLGANCVIPKPMQKDDLLKVLITVSSDLKLFKESEPDLCKKPNILVIDDEKMWRKAVVLDIGNDANVIEFEDPKIFFEVACLNPSLLKNADCILVDYYFKNSNVESCGFLEVVRSLGYEGCIALYSNMSPEYVKGNFDIKIQKGATLSLAALMKSDTNNK